MISRQGLSAFGIASHYTCVDARDAPGVSPNSCNVTAYYDAATGGIRFTAERERVLSVLERNRIRTAT